MNTLQITYSIDRDYYLIPEVKRECPIWLSLIKKPLPIPSHLRGPGVIFAAIMPGRDYYRLGDRLDRRQGSISEVQTDSELVSDYFDASWWSPGLEEAWEKLAETRKELDELKLSSDKGKRRA